MSLASSAVLVELNISSWSGRKLDRKVTDELTQDKGARKDAARVNKNLFAGSNKLERVNSFVAATRKEYTDMTLPWATTGARLLPTKQLFTVLEWATLKETEFSDMVNQFLTEYSALISAQAVRLGTMFDASEYPTTHELRSKFRFAHTLLPMSEAGDFRIDVEEETKQELQQQYAKVFAQRTDEIRRDLWNRLYETVGHLRDKCALDKTIFRASTLENALELCSLLTRLNVTGDTDLEERRQDLENALCGVDTEGLRKDERVRHSTKTAMDALLEKMKGFL